MKDKIRKIEWEELNEDSKGSLLSILLLVYIIIISAFNPIHFLSLIIIYAICILVKKPKIRYYELKEITKRGFKR